MFSVSDNKPSHYSLVCPPSLCLASKLNPDIHLIACLKSLFVFLCFLKPKNLTACSQPFPKCFPVWVFRFFLASVSIDCILFWPVAVYSLRQKLVSNTDLTCSGCGSELERSALTHGLINIPAATLYIHHAGVVS